MVILRSQKIMVYIRDARRELAHYVQNIFDVNIKV